ncbi:hypothetical protein C8F01DRAFT_1079132 [Mycena amicta]|nr:hypothetical protein C8F01DRAFT_1079132 [Mycena amicta]
MVKLGFPVFALFTVLPFAVSAASFAKRASSSRSLNSDLNVTSITSSSGSSACNDLCKQPAVVLAQSCVGVETLSQVPCGCTDAYSEAQEACSRCRLPFSGDSNTLSSNTFNEQHNFDG